MLFVTLISLLFLYIVKLFKDNHSDKMDTHKEKEIEDIYDQDHLLKDTKESLSEVKIFLKSFDILFGLLY